MIIESKYLIPTSLEDAIEMAKENAGSFVYMAGGTDVMANRFQGNESSTCLIDITKLDQLKGVNQEAGFLKIGALEKLADIENSVEIQNEFFMLAKAAGLVAGPVIRKSATIGGNVLCENRCIFYNQSEWWRESVGLCLKCDGDICIATQGKKACFSELVSDTAAALIAMNAEVEIIDTDGTRRIILEDIYSGDGVNPRNLSETSIIKAFYLPLDRKFRTAFYKLRERESLEFTSLTSAISVDRDDEIKIALSGVDPKPVVVVGKMGDDPDELIKRSVKGARAIDNDMYTRKYRREMIRVYLERSFAELNIK